MEFKHKQVILVRKLEALMQNNPKPDYSGYSSEELMDIYISMDKDKDPETAHAIEKELREKLNVPQQTVNKGFDLYEFMHLRRIGFITGVIPGIGILFVILNIMLSPTTVHIDSYYPKHLYLHLFILSLLGYGVFKRSITAGILLVIYIIIMLSFYLFR